MENIEYKDFYFIYVLAGSNYIKPTIHSFPYIPKEANVVIITNTKKVLEGIKTEFNLIVEDLDSLRDDWSIEKEKLIDIDDEEEYMNTLIDWYRNGYSFPMAIMRYGMKWAIKNNITKFCIVDCGVKIGMDTDPLNAINEINLLSERYNKNVIFGPHLQFHEEADHAKSDLEFMKLWKEICLKYISQDQYDNWPESYQYMHNKNQRGAIKYDGWMIGLWAKDISIVEVTFNLWNDLVKCSYDYPEFHKDHNRAWVTAFEWQSLIFSAILSKYYNTILSGFLGIVTHYQQPENDFFDSGMSIKWRFDKFKPTNTREEFLQVNRELLIEKYRGIENTLKLVWGFKK